MTTTHHYENAEGTVSITVDVSAEGGVTGTVHLKNGEVLSLDGAVFVGPDDDPAQVAAATYAECLASYTV